MAWDWFSFLIGCDVAFISCVAALAFYLKGAKP